MTIIVNSDLTGLQDFPPIGDFLIGVPSDGLVSIFRAAARVTEDGGAVSEWAGSGGYSAVQLGAANRPTKSIDAILFDGLDDYLETLIEPPVSGYIVAKIVAKEGVAGTYVVAGSQEAPTDRMTIGYASAMKPGFQIGSTTLSTLVATTTMVADQEYVIGGYWHAGTATIRVNGTQENSAIYNAGGETAGNSPIYLGARNVSSGSKLNSPASIKALAIYSGSGLDLAAIDAAMAAF